MAKVYDDVFGKEEKVHEFVTPEEGREIALKEPDVFAKLFDTEVEDDQ